VTQVTLIDPYTIIEAFGIDLSDQNVNKTMSQQKRESRKSKKKVALKTDSSFATDNFSDDGKGFNLNK